MIISAKTDVGKVREENQDFYAVGQLPDGVFGVVCDGMGGAAGGRTASTTACEAFASAFPASYASSGARKSLKSVFSVLADRANRAVYDLSLRKPELQGMGTTLVAAVLNDSKVSVCHAGDSRAYLLHDGQLRQLTRDHSMVQQLVDSGYISEEQAEHHMYKNIITRALGTQPDIQVDYGEYDIVQGDMVLLCSDGLTNYLEKEQMISILTESEPEDAVQQLVDAANDSGGGDNITVVLMKNS